MDKASWASGRWAACGWHRKGLANELEATIGQEGRAQSAAQERLSPLGRSWGWLAVWDGEVADSSRAADGASCRVVGLRCLRAWCKAESALPAALL